MQILLKIKGLVRVLLQIAFCHYKSSTTRRNLILFLNNLLKLANKSMQITKEKEIVGQCKSQKKAAFLKRTLPFVYELTL